MTLGQAFEVAYQMALKDQQRPDALPDKASLHSRSLSVGGPMAAASAADANSNGSASAASAAVTANGVPNGSSHVRSKSCGEHPIHAAPKLVLTEDV